MKTTDHINRQAENADETRNPLHCLFTTPPLGVIYAIGFAIVLLQLRSLL